MNNRVINLKGEWRVVFNGTILRYTWMERGPALACLDLLSKGYGVVTPDRGVKYI